MKITVFRETIGGVEVVDATYADRLFTAIQEVATTRDLAYHISWTTNQCKEIFGYDSEEYALWKSDTKNAFKKYKNAWRSLKKVMAEAQAIE